MLFSKAYIDNSYAQLPSAFYAAVSLSPVTEPQLIIANLALAEQLSLDVDCLSAESALAIFAGNALPNQLEPIALVYAGHQFGHFAGQLGDGRATLIAEVIDKAGKRYDIQLKGAGPTAYSRRGDGRSPLGPAIREYLVSEAMAALGIPTTRSLALVATGESVYRETPLAGGISTRVASSHIRVGTFEHFAASGNIDNLRCLADYTIARHYPECKHSGSRYLCLLSAFVKRQATLIAAWMSVGFIHGVMNTDNMTLSGETIDYGPCAFMETYNPHQVFSAIDVQGRYSYANQPGIAQWNCARLAESLLPLLDGEKAQVKEQLTSVIASFSAQYHAEWLTRFSKKLGLLEAREKDEVLVSDFLSLLERNKADFSLSFYSLIDAASNDMSALEAQLTPDEKYHVWLTAWRERITQQAIPISDCQQIMRSANPYLIPRNHLVEQVINAAYTEQDYSLFYALNDAWQMPYEKNSAFHTFHQAAKSNQRVHQTFCGT